MGTRDYPRLSILPFAEHLLKSQDLDPIYVALAHANFGAVSLRRWCLSYWTFYDAAVSCYLAEAENAEDFWRRFEQAAQNKIESPAGGRWPRGHERRHMRGANATQCYADLKKRYPTNPEDFATFCTTEVTQCHEVMRRVKIHKQFGPWIGFKIADMAERVLGVPIDFTRAEVFMFADPKKAALMFWRLSQGLHPKAKPRDETHVLELVVHWLKNMLVELKAPPHHDRPVGLQEIETVLCKWKSHMNGHYPPNNDTIEIRQGLGPWLKHSEFACRFLEAMPSVEPW